MAEFLNARGYGRAAELPFPKDLIAAVIDEANDEAVRNRELRRLRGEIQRLEEEKQDLVQRLSELEEARAKVPKKISTS